MTKLEEEAVDKILDACRLLGWLIAVTEENKDTQMEGLVIGTESYLAKILSKEKDNSDLYELNNNK